MRYKMNKRLKFILKPLENYQKTFQLTTFHGSL